MPENKVNLEIKVVKQDSKPPENPLTGAFNHLLGGLLIVARQIEADKNFNVPTKVGRFLDEFGGKAT